MRVALAVLLLIHGAIHVLGFVRAFGLARLSALRGETLFELPASFERPVGVLWLVACVLLVVAAAMLLPRVTGWWYLAAAGAIVSQVLVVHAWPEAKIGTLPNVIVLFAAVLAWADARFQSDGDAAVRRLLGSVPPSPAAVVTRAELSVLPAPVRRWLEASGVVGRPRVRSAHLRQRGGLRTSPDQAFMPAEAEQHVSIVDVPGFVWRVRVVMKGVLPIAGRDTYLDGRGRMTIAAASLVPLVDADGPAIDQGTLLRFLAEIVWFPSAALSPYLRWEAGDDTSARATMTYRGVIGTALFHVDAEGRFVRLTAQRYMGGGPDATLEEWGVVARAWRELHGVTIPVEGAVLWKVAGGDFDYYQWEITDIEYDPTRATAR